MAKLTARTPKGMRDFLPADMIKRQYVFGVIREVFESFGFEPIDTPVLELRENLMGSNYGEEAEKLIYYAQHPGAKEELALRYDLTVPLSRFFAAHENELSLPFRRYHIAPVWRGDRPQRGKFREFYQCDADIVGIRGLNADAEVVSVVYTALKRLGFADFSVKYNNRKLLAGIGTHSGIPQEKLPFLYRTIDKTDKIGLEGVAEEFRKDGLPEDTIRRVMGMLIVEDGDASKRLAALGHLREEMDGNETAQEGIRELEELTQILDGMGVLANTAIDFTMVRGLGYYTGPIFETVITKPENLGSVQGGGRYDELIGLFRGQSLPTTGISLGIERILELMDMLNLYPASIGSTVVQALVTLFSDDLQTDALKLAMELREAGVRTETYMDARKGIGKQIGYADSKRIPMVVIAGPDELKAGQVRLKRLADGHEETVARKDLGSATRRLLNLA